MSLSAPSWPPFCSSLPVSHCSSYPPIISMQNTCAFGSCKPSLAECLDTQLLWCLGPSEACRRRLQQPSLSRSRCTTPPDTVSPPRRSRSSGPALWLWYLHSSPSFSSRQSSTSSQGPRSISLLQYLPWPWYLCCFQYASLSFQGLKTSTENI